MALALLVRQDLLAVRRLATHAPAGPGGGGPSLASTPRFCGRAISTSSRSTTRSSTSSQYQGRHHEQHEQQSHRLDVAVLLALQVEKQF